MLVDLLAKTEDWKIMAIALAPDQSHAVVAELRHQLGSRVDFEQNFSIDQWEEILLGSHLLSCSHAVLWSIFLSEKEAKELLFPAHSFWMQSKERVLLLCPSSASLAHIKKKLPAYAVTIDLVGQKPWERERFLIGWGERFSKRCGKEIGYELLKILVDRAEGSLDYFRTELEKWMTFLGDRKAMTLKDLEQEPAPLDQSTIWSLAHKIAWDEVCDWGGLLALTPSMTPLFCGALRYQWELGAKWWSLAQTGRDAAHILEELQLSGHRGAVIGKAIALFSLTYFQAQLLLLFEEEWRLRDTTNAAATALRWQALIYKIRTLRTIYLQEREGLKKGALPH